MKKFMKKLAKKAEGFTLVELIVVIAILGILAGIAVPAYSGYLEKANDAGVVVELDAIKTAALGANAAAGTIETITVNGAGTTVTVTGDADLAASFDDDFAMYYDIEATAVSVTDDTATITISAPANWDNSSYSKGAEWDGTKWEAKTVS